MKSAADAAFEVLCESRTVVVVDVETCPAADGDHIVAIAAVTCRNGAIRGTWSTVIDPGVPVTNSAYHGLSDADVAGKPAFADVVDSIAGLFDDPGTVLVAHNASFDVGRLHLEYSRLGTGQALPDVAVLDTMRLPDLLGVAMPSRSRTLAACCAAFEVTNFRPHDPVSDATATAGVLLHLLRAAARRRWTDLGRLHSHAGGATTASIEPAAAEAAKAARVRLELPAEHLATHTVLLSPLATPAELDTWAANAVECARLRCHLLDDKAAVALAHAPELHERLSKHLVAQAASFEPGQGATLVGALNVLAPRALTVQGRPFRWQRHKAVVAGLARCHPDAGLCPDCEAGRPCPVDVAHHPLVVTSVCTPDGHLPPARRIRVFRNPTETATCLTKWPTKGCDDMAGYAAWLAIDAWLADHNQVRADIIIDYAIAKHLHDPRVVRVHAERLAAQQRHPDVKRLIEATLATRTTDPGYAELDEWYLRYQAYRGRRRTPRPQGHSGLNPRTARPASRTRSRRFTVG